MALAPESSPRRNGTQGDVRRRKLLYPTCDLLGMTQTFSTCRLEKEAALAKNSSSPELDGRERA